MTLSSHIIFCVWLDSWPCLEIAFFLVSVILDLICTLLVKRGFTVLQKVFMSLTSFVFKLLKTDFFSCLIKLKQMLCCLVYALQSKPLFVFKNLFLSQLLFIICLLIFLFMKGAWLVLTYHFFKGACVSRVWWITFLKVSKFKSSFLLHISEKVNQRLLMLHYQNCNNCNIWWYLTFAFYRLLSLLLKTIYGSQTIQFL